MKVIGIFKEMDGAPSEFQLLPDGRIEIEGESPAFLDGDAAQSIIGEFYRRGNDIVIDYEHRTLKDVESPAAGWVKRLEYKGKAGLWAVVEWTERAKKYLQEREYRYFSPVFWVTTKERKVARIEHVALTNYPKINNLKPIMAKMGTDEDRRAQEERSRKWGIGIKEGGHLTKPSEWDDVPDDEFLDPVNYRYPCPDADQTHAAASYWGVQKNQSQYNPEERSIINGRLDKLRKKYKIGEYRKEAKMLEKLRKLLGLTDDASEDKVIESVERVAVKSEEMEKGGEVVACKEVIDALGAKETASKEDLIQIIAGIKAPGDTAVKLSHEVATLTKEIAEMKQSGLVERALKEGKTSPDELDKWGRDLARKNPEQFEKIVLSRSEGSVIPIGGLPALGDKGGKGNVNDATLQVAKMMGVSEDDIKKYGGE